MTKKMGIRARDIASKSPPPTPAPITKAYIKPFGERIRHVSVGKLIVGQGTDAACGKKIGKFNLARENDKTPLCGGCRKALLP